MNSFDGVDYDAISAAMNRCGNGPYIDVVDREAPMPLHLIHFGQEGFAQSPLIYAHRNGGGSMFVALKAGGYRMCRYWKDREEVNKFPTRFERADAQDLFGMVSPNETETLQMLPRSVSMPMQQRVVSFREHLIPIRFARGQDLFTLAYGAPGGGVTVSPEFEGKAWESRDAVDWCQKMIPNMRDELELARTNLTVGAMIEMELEDHPGAFLF